MGRWPAVRAMAAVGLIATTGVLLGDLQTVGMALLGAACAVSHFAKVFYRDRLSALAAPLTGQIRRSLDTARFWNGD